MTNENRIIIYTVQGVVRIAQMNKPQTFQL